MVFCLFVWVFIEEGVYVRGNLITCHVETNPITFLSHRRQTQACDALSTAGLLPAQRHLPVPVACGNLSPVLLPPGHFSTFCT